MIGQVAHYVKSHGLGNDYIVIDPAKVPFEVTPEAVRLICDRHRGVGSDGILLVAPGDGADFGVRIFNPDGSEAEKSGNGARIFAKFLRDHRYTEADRFTLHTAGGRVSCILRLEHGRVVQVTVDMGQARFDPLDAIEVDGRRIEVPRCRWEIRTASSSSRISPRSTFMRLARRSKGTRPFRRVRTFSSRRSCPDRRYAS